MDNKIWTKSKYKELKNELLSLSEESYKNFNKKLIPGKDNILGIRIPVLKGKAREIIKSDFEGYLSVAEDEFYEEVMLKGFVIGSAKMEFDKRLEYIKKFVPLIDNWAVNDSFCASLKSVNKNKEKTFEFLKQYLNSDKEFEIRFAVIMLMDYFVDEGYIDSVLDIYDNIKSDKYYVNMGVAWGISLCFVKFRNKTIEYLKRSRLDNFTYNKGLQKIIESNRVEKDDKDLIRSMKKK